MPSGQPSEAASSSRSSCSSSGLRPLSKGSLAKAEAAAATVNCHDVTKRMEVQCTANPDAVFPDVKPSIVTRGVHGQHDGSSSVIHLSRGRCPSLHEFKASDGRSILLWGTRSTSAQKERQIGNAEGHIISSRGVLQCSLHRRFDQHGPHRGRRRRCCSMNSVRFLF